MKGNLTVEIQDEILGDRRLTVSFSGQGAQAEGTNAKTKRHLRGDVDLISQIFCGYTGAQQAYELDLVEFEGKDTVEFCQHAFALPPPRCYDLF